MISKIIFPVSLLSVPTFVKDEVKEMIFKFLWKGKDKVKRSVLVNEKCNGGLNMINIDCFFDALKASWITRIINCKGKWKSILEYYVNNQGIPLNYLLQMSFKTTRSFPIINKLPLFYRDILFAFNRLKSCIPMESMEEESFLQQPLFGNNAFKHNDECLYFRNWIRCNIMYVKDLVANDGTVLSDADIYRIIGSKQNIISELYTLKHVLFRKLKTCNLIRATNIDTQQNISFVYKSKIYIIKDQKCKFFYFMLLKNVKERSYMEERWANTFKFENNCDVWKTIYQEKLIYVFDKKLAEFNFKVIHNYLPCGYTTSKFERDVSSTCEYCGSIENMQHMLFLCPRINVLWGNISKSLHIDICWRLLVCGSMQRDNSTKIQCQNMILSYTMYSIFIQNVKSKYEKKTTKILT
ncbi:MAG: hypothetical protein GY697_00120 [Desulfobacterales bacterium]|nr:hypothetical protein [Desulfobacterales bacterium]